MKRLHYGWAVCLAGTLLLFITMGTVSNGFSIYLPYILEQHGFTNSQTSFLVTLRCLVSFLAMLGIGVYYQKVSIRMGTGLAAACAGAAYWLYSAAETYPVFCLGAALSGFSYGLGSMIPVSILMNRWFVRRKALALSVCASGSSIATILLPPITTAMVEGQSMKTAFRIESIAIFALTGLIVLLLRSSPAEMGLPPYGGVPEEKDGQPESQGKSFGLPPRTWALMACVSLFMGALANPGFSHLSVLFASEGFDSGVVAAIISGTGIMITLGKLLYGAVADRVGGCRSSLLFGGLLLGGHLLCCLAFLQSIPLCLATVLLLGVGYPIATIGPSVWAGDMCSQDHYPKTLRRFQVIYAGGALAFSSVPGILADHLGGYLPAYLLFSLLLALALCFLGVSYRRSRRMAR